MEGQIEGAGGIEAFDAERGPVVEVAALLLAQPREQGLAKLVVDEGAGRALGVQPDDVPLPGDRDRPGRIWRLVPGERGG
ncbi:hypothetical protein [Nitrospira sp. Kam-Ns4a]